MQKSETELPTTTILLKSRSWFRTTNNQQTDGPNEGHTEGVNPPPYLTTIPSNPVRPHNRMST